MEKEYEIPKLIVLARSMPEEAILGACKKSTRSYGPGSAYVPDCRYSGGCGACHSYSST